MLNAECRHDADSRIPYRLHSEFSILHYTDQGSYDQNRILPIEPSLPPVASGLQVTVGEVSVSP